MNGKGEQPKSSSGGESHPSALTEPDVRLSPHPAPTIQPPASRRAATGRRARGPVAQCAPASARTHVPTSKPFVFPSRPRCEGLIEMAKDVNTPRPIEAAVVVHPATHHRVD